MTYAFTFDSGSCTGCKACQVACKDKNNLPLGVLWRRVYEVCGGEWKNVGARSSRPGNGEPCDVWENTIFAYNLSIACNHCVHPKCAGVCPTDAYEVRPDGIVLINTQKCIGCGYCAWACPYDAPQVDRSAGHMTKCNLCYDNLDAGLPPACVAACPLRCLELVKSDDQGIEDRGLVLWKTPGVEHPFPLPKLSRTEPHLVIKPHPAMVNGLEKVVANREEIQPRRYPSVKNNIPLWLRDFVVNGLGEIPLIVFTLLAQMAMGAFGAIFMIYWALSDKLVAGQITFIPLLAVGAAITVALLASFFHLGTPKNSWRALGHLRKSWLSRELLFTSAFAGLWALHTGLRLFQIGSFSVWLSLAALTALCGLAAVYGMQRVYQLRSVPAWNTARTLLEFCISTLGLGCLLTGILLPRSAPAGVVGWIALAGILAFSAAGWVTKSSANSVNMNLSKWRAGLLLAGLLGAVALFIWPSSAQMGTMFLLFIIALVEEAIGRWIFYARRNPGI